MNRIRRHLSAKLSIGITLLAAPIFVLALGILFLYSRHLIRQETMKQATGALHTTEQRVKSTMSMVQNAVNSNCWLLEEHFRPDSLESIRQRGIEAVAASRQTPLKYAKEKKVPSSASLPRATPSSPIPRRCALMEATSRA